MFKKVLATGAMLALAASAAQAQTTVYNSIDFATTGAYAGDYGGAGATALNPYTELIADDINVLAGYGGGTVTAFTWTESDHNTTTTTDSITPVISFYAANGTGGGPGTLIKEITFTPGTLNNGFIYRENYSPGAAIFTIPTSGLFWAGISFTAASSAVANNIDEGVFAPSGSTIGTSSNNFFQATNPGPGNANNPAGSATANFGGAYNFGWTFTATAPAATPEPSQYAAFGLGILGVGALALKARRRSVA